MKMDATIQQIDIDDIIPNRFQPRLYFDAQELDNLADSIKEHGIIQPLVVRRLLDKYEIIAGERRYKAASKLGLSTVPAIIADISDNESAEIAIVENTQRKNLSPIEEAKSYKKLLDKKYITQEQLAKRMGISQSNIANKLRLLNLDESVQTALSKQEITERHARSLLKVTDKKLQVEILNKIINEGWTVKKLDAEIINILNGYKNNNLDGPISRNRIDVDINKIINNSADIKIESPVSYKYKNPLNESENKKSLFFNNLESVSANMDSTLPFGFNPFFTEDLKPNGLNNEVDYELLDIDEKVDNSLPKDLPINNNPIETKEDVLKAIKSIIKEAKANDIAINIEEFDFDNLYQFIVRVDK